MEGILKNLPRYLNERIRMVRPRPMPHAGDFILYWMRTAIRSDENPALDVAIHVANELNMPVLVYQGLSQDYPFASDRHHTFIIQGAKDIQDELVARNVVHVFHLERPGHRGTHLKSLAGRARLVITEDMPVDPLTRWTLALSRQIQIPLWRVDTACIVPMQLVGRAYDRAYEYREATAQLYAERVGRQWQQVPAGIRFDDWKVLPFEPIDWKRSEVSDLVAECEIDHGVGPVIDTPGGTSNGYARWNAFKERGLQNYARLRNDALVDGVSRMSAYLHYGMVSPMRMAREASALGHAGAEKYLDELLIWRELAYAFCFYRADHNRVSALPEWARRTLAEHRSDPRSTIYSMETLARGQTADALWNAAQRSLLMHGGGLLWCLGQFDRPFYPARPRFGTVRDRSTQEHSRRLDPAKFMSKISRPNTQPIAIIAVIGAGLSGLVCARTLIDHGLEVTVFEKSRSLGGRMATRRELNGLQFDHGAQYFTARDVRFQRYVDAWLHDGLVKAWDGRIVSLCRGALRPLDHETTRYIATPGMNALGTHLARDVNVILKTQVESLQRRQDRWQLVGDREQLLGEFDVVAVSAPAPQTAKLIQGNADFAQRVHQVGMQGCWCVMIAMSERLELEFDGAFVQGSPISWIARESRKPDRGVQPERWLIHASSDWSESHMELDASEIQASLIEEFWDVTRSTPQPLLIKTSHRWRFATPVQPLEESCLFDSNRMLGVCGDWCGGPRVEGAFLSGMALAGRILGALPLPSVDKCNDLAIQLKLF